MDPVANFLTSLRNASLVRKDEAVVPASQLVRAIADVLAAERFIGGVAEETSETGRRTLRIRLRYDQGQPMIGQIRRISTPGRRVYVPTTRIPRPRLGVGMTILSTSAGVMSDRQARKAKVGGEVVAEVIRGVAVGSAQ